MLEHSRSAAETASMIALLSELTARHLTKTPVRSVMVALVLALGVALYLAVVSASARTVGEFERFVHRTSGRTDLSIESPGMGLLRDSVDSVREVPGVLHAAARAEVPVQATDLGESLLLIGVDRPGDGDFSPFESSDGNPWPPPARATSGGPAAVFLSERFASRHGLAPGSLLRLQAATAQREFIVRGTLSDSGAAAAFDGHFAAMFLDSLQVEFGRGNFVDRIDVALAPGADRQVVERSFRDLLGQGVAIGAAERRGIRLRTLVEPLRGSLRLSGLLGMLGVLASLLAVLLGARPASDGPLPANRRSPAFYPTPVPVLRLAVLGIVPLLAAWVPVLQGAHWLALIALGVTVAGVLLITPALVVASCRTFASAAGILAVPRRFGRRGVGRTLGRGSINLFALVVAVGTAVCVVGWLSSFERSVTRWADEVGLEDLTVTRGSPLEGQSQVVFAGSVSETVERIPGVGRVQSHRRFEQSVDERVITLSVTDTDTFIEQAALQGKTWPLLRGAPLRQGELEHGPEILLSDSAARSLGKDIGDSVTVHAAKGDVSFIVRGITGGGSDSGAIDRRHLISYWGDETVDRISVYVAPGHPPERVAADIAAALGSDGSVFVTATSSLRAGILGSLRPTFEQARSLQLATLGLALLALVATLSAPHLSSGPKGGATPSPPRRLASVAFGGAGLGLCVVVAGSALGLLARALLTRAILGADPGWQLDLQFPWRAVLPIGLVAITALAVAAAVAPGERVAPSD
jgi:hypothetical protein